MEAAVGLEGAWAPLLPPPNTHKPPPQGRRRRGEVGGGRRGASPLPLILALSLPRSSFFINYSKMISSWAGDMSNFKWSFFFCNYHEKEWRLRVQPGTNLERVREGDFFLINVKIWCANMVKIVFDSVFQFFMGVWAPTTNVAPLLYTTIYTIEKWMDIMYQT
jgi:hypothetical protein